MKKTDSDISALPLTKAGVEKFLASPAVEGIGPAFARIIVERFGTDAIRVLTEHPEEIASIPGIGESRAKKASESLAASKCSPEVVAFLFSCDVSETFIDRIIGKYRRRVLSVIVEDPYSMIEEVWLLSFFIADKIGRALGIEPGDSRRLRGALVTAVKHFAQLGHLFARPSQAIQFAAGITDQSETLVEEQIEAAINSGKLIMSQGGLYLPVYFKAEKEGAQKLTELAMANVGHVAEDEIPYESRQGHYYSATQRDAISMLVNSPVAVLTGGPGSGKTTVLRGVLDVFERLGIKTILCAPTGRAAKRMSNLTGVEAFTIHRLLGYRQGEGYRKKYIETSALIIDEGSMMEQVLFNHLLEGLTQGTRVIMVGDVDQLPAIGAGDVLRDLMNSGVVPVARLSENFRQGAGSRIAASAAEINAGIVPQSYPGSDFEIITENSVKAIHSKILKLMAYELPEKYDIAPTDIRVVTPQQIGRLGARQLNIDLQQKLNPDAPALRRGATEFRLGDPVMQTANSRDRGLYNGEVGVISEVDVDSQILTVSFDDGRKSKYERQELSELVLAYAMTVHKLQGSEVRYMIFPVTLAHKPMLYRNLLYTGVSRATELCVIVGEPEALEYAVGNNPEATRNSNFADRLRYLRDTWVSEKYD